STVLGALFWLNCLAPNSAQAQFMMPIAAQQQHVPAKPLALPAPGGTQRVLGSTGFFVDDTGHLLTARHAVEGCVRVRISKEKWRLDARVVAVSSRYDLALLKTSKTLGLAAVFPRTAVPSVNEMVFAGAYTTLTDTPASRSIFANARVLGSFGGSEA